MAAMIRLFRSSSSSSNSTALFSRYLSTAAASETVKSQSYPLNPLPTSVEPKAKTVQWVFLGCPGVGKGTYASRLSTLLGVPHIATGDLVRDELKSSGPLSKQVALMSRFCPREQCLRGIISAYVEKSCPTWCFLGLQFVHVIVLETSKTFFCFLPLLLQTPLDYGKIFFRF
ncbi:hypothetical protein HAX54_011059 [Datura stramonium]|uniref:adenylate kinase n=1 Tax=Datura stramonium TaxID=4076 RepID=A0ABS8X189_DATST|nr:hypothetical protein [Datura stramonium]